MLKTSLIFCFVLFSSIVLAQEEVSPDIEVLKKRVQELEEIQQENSEILKRQLADQHFDQNSRGYIEIKIGQSMFEPKDINDLNKDVFNETNSASWSEFDRATILEFEIGKSILYTDSVKHEIGIGYQHFRSKIDGSFTNGGNEIDFYETVSIHTLYARYVALFQINDNKKFFMGPGITFGYSPITKLDVELEEGNEGLKVSAEGTSYLIELFGKAKLEFSRYFSIVATAGYRIQEAENLRLNAADLVSIKRKEDLDASGLFGSVGLAVAF